MFIRSLLATLLVLLGAAHPPTECLECKEIINYIFENLEECGTLKQDDKGFVYVDINDDYILKLNDLIANEGFIPPPYFGGPEMHGAHISVIYAREAVDHDLIGMIKEVGSTVHFRAKSCKIVHPPNWRNVEEVYFITVDAPSLAKLRKKYGLPRNHFEFHITIGIKPSAAQAA